MTGAYFCNPDCLEPMPAGRSRNELLEAAETVKPYGIFVVTQTEFDSIKREVGLGYMWKGRRIFVR